MPAEKLVMCKLSLIGFQITDNNLIEPGTRNQEQRLVTANLIFTALF